MKLQYRWGGGTLGSQKIIAPVCILYVSCFTIRVLNHTNIVTTLMGKEAFYFDVTCDKNSVVRYLATGGCICYEVNDIGIKVCKKLQNIVSLQDN